MNFGIICDLFIASSSDCEKAKPIIAQACYEWNQVHGHKEKVFILPRFCEVDGYPALCRPQDQLNKILDQCDIAVALVWYKFANGLREELERSIQQQKKLLVYFSEQGISPKKFNEANIDAIENFKSSYQENVYWWSYESDAQLAELFKRQLQQTMNDLLENEIADYKSELDALSKENQVPLNAVNNSNAPALPTPVKTPLPKEMAEILLLASEDDDQGFRILKSYDGVTNYGIECNGQTFNYPPSVGSTVAERHKQDAYWRHSIIEPMCYRFFFFERNDDYGDSCFYRKLKLRLNGKQANFDFEEFHLTQEGYNAIEILKTKKANGEEPILYQHQEPRRRA